MDRYEQWWHDLSDDQRREAVSVQVDVPEWMAETLGHARLPLVPADLAAQDGLTYTRALLMPTSLRDFLDHQRQLQRSTTDGGSDGTEIADVGDEVD